MMARAAGDAADRLGIFGLRYGTEGIRWLAAYLHHFIARMNAPDQAVEELLPGDILSILDLDKAKVRKGVAAASEIRKLLDGRDVDGFAMRWAQIADDGLSTVTIWALLCAAATAVSMSTMLNTSAGLPPYLPFPMPIYGHPN